MRIQNFFILAVLVVVTEARRAAPPVAVPKRAFGIQNPYCFGQDKKHLPADNKPDEKKVKEVKAGTTHMFVRVCMTGNFILLIASKLSLSLSLSLA